MSKCHLAGQTVSVGQFWTCMNSKICCFLSWTSEGKSDTVEDDLPLLHLGGVLLTRFGNSVLFALKNKIGRKFLPMLETSNEWWHSLQCTVFKLEPFSSQAWTLFRMSLFEAAKSPLPKICRTYPKMMKLGTLIPYLKKIQKIYKSQDTPLKFCWH